MPNTCVTPCLSIRKRFMVQFPVDKAFAKPLVIKS